MTDGFTETEETAPRNRKPRVPYVRTNLDAQMLVVRQMNAKLQKLPNKDARIRALKMLTENIESEV